MPSRVRFQLSLGTRGAPLCGGAALRFLYKVTGLKRVNFPSTIVAAREMVKTAKATNQDCAFLSLTVLREKRNASRTRDLHKVMLRKAGVRKLRKKPKPQQELFERQVEAAQQAVERMARGFDVGQAQMRAAPAPEAPAPVWRWVNLGANNF